MPSYYDQEKGRNVPVPDGYDSVEIVVSEYDPEEGAQTHPVEVWKHEATGILVFDIAKFENFLRRSGI